VTAIHSFSRLSSASLIDSGLQRRVGFGENIENEESEKSVRVGELRHSELKIREEKVCNVLKECWLKHGWYFRLKGQQLPGTALF